MTVAKKSGRIMYELVELKHKAVNSSIKIWSIYGI